ncbi:transglycosylase SLT domain-containing protein [Patescibacteria group bacterium]|nr:transglycosylase SLT domain-containing protein [Patescibacteria group bacterium]
MRSSFFLPFSGLVAASIFLLTAPQASAQVAPSSTENTVATTTVELPPVEPPRVFFHMADGRWYDPRSGYTAPTEQALRDLINPPPQPVPSDGASVPSVPLSPLQSFPLLQAIRRGQSLLNETLTQSSTLLSTKPDWAPVQLAVWRSASDIIEIIPIEKQGAEIRGTDPRIGQINVLLSRQLQSQYQLASTGDVVVAIRYPLYRAVTVGKKQKYEREDVIYSPYSPILHTEDMVRYGHAWLDQEFQKLADDLRARGVRSRFDPSKSLADVISPDVARAILLIEHTDQTSITQDPRATYARMLVTVAANATTSYAFSNSHVGAQGFAQFMPSTYKLVAKEEALGLPAKVEEGTRNFETALKAQVSYLDRLWSVMPNQAKAMMSTNPDQAAAFVVAAYNGGEGRIQKASNVWGESWATPDIQVVKAAETEVVNATAALKKAKKAVTAAKTTKAKTQANATLKKANTTLANAQAKFSRLQAGTLRDETIGYVAKFYEALKGIRQVKAELQGIPAVVPSQPEVTIASVSSTPGGI